jgi:DNA-directed RNA polymerase specialized sigma24 family protein
VRELSPQQRSGLGCDYATDEDFCKAFDSETKPLYLLAYLLTADHEAAEKCFILTVEESFEQKNVFKGWVHSWVKHRLVKNAIRIMFPESPRMSRSPEQILAEQDGPLEDLIEHVTRLPLLDRFVFVLSVLERYPTQKCSVLLKCSVDRVVRARAAAMNHLALRFQPLSREQLNEVFPPSVLAWEPTVELNLGCTALTEFLVLSESS